MIRPGQPHPFEAEAHFKVDYELIDSAERLAEVVDRMHRTWQGRRRMVVKLEVDQHRLRQPQVINQPLWELGADFTLVKERLHFLIWANNWDCRDGKPIWWWGRKAANLGGTVKGRADIITADGSHVWVDGGPREPLDLEVVSSESIEAGRLVLQKPSGQVLSHDLDPAQLAAVEHRSGPARVIATAGSGKTRTLLARLRYLVDNLGVEPGLITALAYNKRAADEMKQRLDRSDLHIRTIHSLGWAIVREVLDNPTLLEERGVRDILRQMVPDQRTPNKDTIGYYLEALSDTRMKLSDPTDTEDERSDIPGFARVFHRYRDRLRREGLADFDEQVYLAVELLLASPELRTRWQRKCRHLLVDEFQDLTPIYLLLLRILASPRLNVFGVGDDDQTIYGYAGADPKFLIHYDRLFPGAAEYSLDTNYRSTAPAVKAAKCLVEHNRERVPKQLVPSTGADDRPECFDIQEWPDRDITDKAVQQIQKWLDSGGWAWDIALLTRVNSSLLPVLIGLSQAGIPVQSKLSEGWLNNWLQGSVVKAALAWMRMALNPSKLRRSDLQEAVRRPARGLNQVSRELLRARSYSTDDLIRQADGLSERHAVSWLQWVQDILAAARLAETGRAGPLLDWMIQDLGLDRSAHLLDRNRTRADKAAHGDNLVALRRSADLLDQLDTFEQQLRQTVSGAVGADHGVTLSTIHRVKGAEWKRVIVFGVEHGSMPHVLAEDIEEERRILYVAATRGQDQVVVMAASERPSPFLDEMRCRPQPTHPEPALSSQKKAPAADPPGFDPDLFEKLREWRLAQAKERKVSAFIVFYDRTLREIAARKPLNRRELNAISGVGPTKMDLYGEDVLQIVREHTGG